MRTVREAIAEERAIKKEIAKLAYRVRTAKTQSAQQLFAWFKEQFEDHLAWTQAFDSWEPIIERGSIAFSSEGWSFMANVFKKLGERELRRAERLQAVVDALEAVH
jgi:hypothetical protein